MSDNPIKLFQFVLSLLRFNLPKALTTICLMTLASTTSGVGILLIIPMLKLVGVVPEIGSSSLFEQIELYLNQFFGFLHLGDPTIEILLVCYVVLITVVALLAYWSSILTAAFQQSYIISMRRRIFRAILNADWAFVRDVRSTAYVRMATTQVQSIGHGLNNTLTLLGQVISVVVYILISMLISFELTLLALLFAMTVAALLLPITRRAHQSGREELDADLVNFNDAIEQVSNLKIIKSYGAEAEFVSRMDNTSDRLEQQQLRLVRYNALIRLVNLVSAALFFAALFYFSVKVFALTEASLIILLLIYARLMPKLSSLQSLIHSLVHSMPNYYHLNTMLSTLEQHTEQISQGEQIPFVKEIRLDSVSYAYKCGNELALKDLTAKISKGQLVAITGVSGVGKSTFSDLVAGLVSPLKGRIYIDDVLLTDRNRYLWRPKVSYVTQDCFLFNASVRDNLSWVVSEPLSDEKIWAALEAAAIADVIRNLPKGLDSLMGNRGGNFSGGEKQRFAIARALLAEPKILILDEATSALDHKNQLKIIKILAALEGDITILVIAHNDESIRHIENRINL